MNGNDKANKINAVGTAVVGIVGAVLAYNPSFAPFITPVLAIAGYLFGWATPQAGARQNG